MQPYHYSLLGLGLDVVGAFLVAVEAIKLENLRTLRDRVLRRAEDYTRSPNVYFVDGSEEIAREQVTLVPSNRYPGLFMGLHYVAGFIVVVLLDRWLGGEIYQRFIDTVLWVWDKPWYFGVLAILIFVVVGIGMCLWMVGELVHMAISGGVRAAIRGLDFVDARTPDGTVGVLGFLLLLAGFVLQMIGTYLGGQPAA